MDLQSYFDLSNPATRWALYVAGIALILVILAAILAKLGAKKVAVPAWLGGGLVGLFIGAGAVAAYVYITKPVEIPPNPAAEGANYDGGGVGMSGEEGGGGMGGGMMGMGGGMMGMGGPGGGGPGNIPPRVRTLGLINGLDVLAGSYALALTPSQAAKLVESLSPLVETGITDDNADAVADSISEILTEEQVSLLRRVRPTGGRRGGGRGGPGGPGGPGMMGGPGLAGGPGGYPADYPGLQQQQSQGAEQKSEQSAGSEEQPAPEQENPDRELVERVIAKLRRIAAEQPQPEQGEPEATPSEENQ